MWTQIAGLDVEITSANAEVAMVTLPAVETNAILTFQVQVTDEDGETNSDTVDITTIPPAYNLTLYGITVNEPSVIAMGIGVEDRITGEPLTGLTIADGYSDFEVFEDESPLAQREAFLDLEPIDSIPFTFKMVLMIDISSSLTQDDLTEVKNAAKSIVTDLEANQKIAIYQFNDKVTQVIDFSNDLEALTNAIDSISDLSGTSTNLYGAVVEGFGLWENAFSLDQVTYGAMVVITDGNDTAGLATLGQAIQAKGSRDLYALTVGAGVDQDILVQMALGESIDEVSTDDRNRAGELVYAVDSFSEVGVALENIRDGVDFQLEGMYFLYYASPKRAGDP